MIKRHAKTVCAILTALVLPGMAERLVGDSAPFSFPGGVGAVRDSQAAESFSMLEGRLVTEGTVRFTWSMTAKASSGAISIYSLSGRLVDILEIDPGRGTADWDAKAGGVSNGVYLATMEVGLHKQEIKFSIL